MCKRGQVLLAIIPIDCGRLRFLLLEVPLDGLRNQLLRILLSFFSLPLMEGPLCSLLLVEFALFIGNLHHLTVSLAQENRLQQSGSLLLLLFFVACSEVIIRTLILVLILLLLLFFLGILICFLKCV